MGSNSLGPPVIFGFFAFSFGLLFFSFWPFKPPFPFILAFWILIFFRFHFGSLGLHFLSFWPFGPLFPFIFVLWAFISFHFGLLGLHFPTFGENFQSAWLTVKGK